MWQSLQTDQSVSGLGEGWTSPALPQRHISWQLPFSVPCFSLAARRLPSPHQLCFFLPPFSCSGSQNADWRRWRGLPLCRQVLAMWTWGPAGLRLTLSDTWRRQKTEMKKHPELCAELKMGLRQNIRRVLLDAEWLLRWLLGSSLESGCDHGTEM